MLSLLFGSIPTALGKLLPLADFFILTLIPRKKIKPIVLLVRLDAIGDFVLWLDAAKTLVGYYHKKGYSVVLIGNNAWANWAREMQLANEVWGVDVSRFNEQLSYRLQWLFRARRVGSEIAIQPNYSRKFREGDSLIRVSGANERIGSVGDGESITPFFKFWSDTWFTQLIPAVAMPLMELKRNAEFMRGLGFANYQARLPIIQQVPNALPNCLLQKPYAVFVATASWEGREWPIDNFINIGHRLIERGMQIVVVGVQGDHERIACLINDLSGNVLDLVGATSLGELVEVLRDASIVVTNETSSLHIGVAVNVPTICILGGGHFGRFAPYETEVIDEDRNLPIMVIEPMACFGCNWKCQYVRESGEAVKCIKDISVEKVWDAVEMILNKSNKTSVDKICVI